MIRYCVLHKNNKGLIIRGFKTRAEANFFITDCFGPESTQYEILEVDLTV